MEAPEHTDEVKQSEAGDADRAEDPFLAADAVRHPEKREAGRRKEQRDRAQPVQADIHPAFEHGCTMGHGGGKCDNWIRDRGSSCRRLGLAEVVGIATVRELAE
jgi:hypothetical protein